VNKLLIPILLIIITLITGCPRRQAEPPQPPAPPAPPEYSVTVYYGDRGAEFLLPEQRKITVPEGQKLLLLAAAELLLDPQTPDAVRLIPPETEILGVSAENKIITVNFNEKLRDNFTGGSSSEGLLINSVVNTLTGIEGYKDYRVRFLINGEPFDSIGGHISAEELFERNETLIRN
jgi:hypothetical protein